MDISDEHQSQINLLVDTFARARDTGDTQELDEHEATIVLMCGRLVDEDPRLSEFVQSIVDLCTSESLQAWAATPGASLDGSVWSRLSTSLKGVAGAA